MAVFRTFIILESSQLDDMLERYKNAAHFGLRPHILQGENGELRLHMVKKKPLVDGFLKAKKE